MVNVLAFDIGNSHGRAMLGSYDGKKLELKEVHRFVNGGVRVNDNFYWDILKLYEEIKEGIKKAVKLTDRIASIAIDTWGIDYGLLDNRDNLISFPYNYRDKRVEGLYPEIFAICSKDEIYEKTGVQFMEINTLVQLFADKKYRPWALENAKSFLMIPDLLNFFLTGEMFNEFTNASTTQIFNPVERKWEASILNKLNIPDSLFKPIIYPGNEYGLLKKEICDECGIKTEIKVIAVGSHDTASAVAAVPLEDEKSAYISSGTWSLLGTEEDSPVINARSLEENFSNELGVEGRVRLLKNVPGMWMIQECKRIWNNEGIDIGYKEISELAEDIKTDYRIDLDSSLFLNPDNMPRAIKKYCMEHNQPVPETIGEIAYCIYNSLAWTYKKEINSLESILKKDIETIHIVGGGSNVDLLSNLTAKVTGKKVVTGPVEATAMGNCLVQLMALGEIEDLDSARKLVKESEDLNVFYP